MRNFEISFIKRDSNWKSSSESFSRQKARQCIRLKLFSVWTLFLNDVMTLFSNTPSSLFIKSDVKQIQNFLSQSWKVLIDIFIVHQGVNALSPLAPFHILQAFNLRLSIARNLLYASISGSMHKWRRPNHWNFIKHHHILLPFPSKFTT